MNELNVQLLNIKARGTYSRVIPLHFVLIHYEMHCRPIFYNVSCKLKINRLRIYYAHLQSSGSQSSQWMHGHISVMATFKFVYYLNKRDFC
jgi:hypothetical protein